MRIYRNEEITEFQQTNSTIEGGGNQYDGRAKDNGESFIETEPLPQMKYNMWEEDEEEESDSYFKTK